MVIQASYHNAPVTQSTGLLARLRAFNDAALSITAELSPAGVLQLIVETAKDVVGARYAALEEHNEKGDLLLFAHAGMSPEIVARIEHLPRGLGLLGVLLHEPRPIRISDMSRDPRSVGFPAHHPPMKSLLGVPVMARGRVLGNLYFADKLGADEFSEEDEQLAVMLAAHAGIAIENARLYGQTNASLREKIDRLQQAERRARLVADLGELLSRSLKVAAVLPEVAKKTVDVLGDFCAIGLLSSGTGGQLAFVASHGVGYSGLGSGREFLRNTCDRITEHVAHGESAVFVSHLDKGGAPTDLLAAMRKAKFTSGLMLPLRSHNQVFGALVCLGYQPRRMWEAELILGRLLAERIGGALHNAKLYERVETERGELQAVVDGSPAGIIIVDAKTGLISVNRMTERLLGQEIPADKTRDIYLQQIRRPDGSRLSIKQLASTRALRGETVLGEELVILRPQGEPRAALVNAAPVRNEDGEIVAAVATLQDISPLKALEKLREEFTALVAHDLRVPISVIYGYAQLLEKMVREVHDHDKELRAINNIRVSAERLSSMVADLLDASRIDVNRVSLEKRTVNLCQLTRDVVERTVAIGGDHELHVEVDEHAPTIDADPRRLEQVLSNLLSNAMKYSDQGTAITVKLWVDSNQIRLSVANQGPGIPEEELPKLFTRFHRCPSPPNKQVGGLGLGLYIARGLIESHGGRIWAESEIGKLTIFHIALPIQ